MKADGVTTVICGCDPIFPVFLSGVAARENYFPEFIIAGTALTDADIVGQLWNQEFASHAFGVSPLAGVRAADRRRSPTQAFKSVRPDEEPAFSVDLIYYQMYMLAIGIQMAGPNLNPETFQAGMYDYPPQTGPVRPVGLRPGRPHHRRRRPGDLLGPRRRLVATTASPAPTSASTAASATCATSCPPARSPGR